MIFSNLVKIFHIIDVVLVDIFSSSLVLKKIINILLQSGLYILADGQIVKENPKHLNRIVIRGQ